jgi:hypothetical protein
LFFEPFVGTGEQRLKVEWFGFPAGARVERFLEQFTDLIDL